jgi:hypothetical protein
VGIKLVWIVDYWERRAHKIHPFRWWLGGVSVLLIAALWYLAPRAEATASFNLSLYVFVISLVMWIWGALCLAVWFHPSLGNMRYGSPWWLGLPRPAQSFFRGYGAVFLVFWFVLSLGLLIYAGFSAA